MTADMTMAELLEAYPGAQRALFRHFHIGGCASCGFRPEEKLADVCARNDAPPVEEVLTVLQAAHEEDERVLVSAVDAAEAVRGGARLIDIRTREEFDAVHVAGAELFSQDFLQAIMASPDKSRTLILIDHTGRRVLDAAAYFTGHGFSDVRAVRGGIDAWSQEVDTSLPRYTLE
ncbi:MAG: rhodanese-like domain-containing protein [Terrimicrobiaceae bacterium]|nr:rhodanese-like domain-containing protein [Terrimicrobiaceae bacterium]